MFQSIRYKSRFMAIFEMAELVYYSTVRSVRTSHRNALMALGVNILQSVIMVIAFYLFFEILGLRGAKIRGDFLLFMMSGIFMFMTHIKAVNAVSGASGPTSPLMQHAPLNSLVAIVSAALGALYLQVLSMSVILFVYYVVFNPFTIAHPIPAMGMFLLSWGTGCCVGLVLLALKPWFPTFVSMFTMIYQRANMIASGKMFVVNTLPPMLYYMFSWNPLFHIIDQTRGFVFANYFPHKTSLTYPMIIGVILLVIGMMGEFYTRQYVSKSWGARG